MRYLVTTEALMSGIRATTSTGPGLDRPSMASWTPEHQPAWTSALDADYRVWPTCTGSPRDIRRSVRLLGFWRLSPVERRSGCSGVVGRCTRFPGFSSGDALRVRVGSAAGNWSQTGRASSQTRWDSQPETTGPETTRPGQGSPGMLKAPRSRAAAAGPPASRPAFPPFLPDRSAPRRPPCPGRPPCRGRTPAARPRRRPR